MALVIFQSQDAKASTPRPLTPARLLGLLDKAKAYPLLREHYPNAVADVEFSPGSKQSSITDCGDYEVRINEAYRFDLEDTLIFRLTLQNKTSKTIQYEPEQVELKAGTHTLFPSVAQLAGSIPAHGTSEGYVAFTGSPDGERNDLSLKNDFTFLLNRVPPASDDLPKHNQEGFKK